MITAEAGRAHELVGRVYAVLRFGKLLGAIERRGDTVTITLSVEAYNALVRDINAARLNGEEPLEVLA